MEPTLFKGTCNVTDLKQRKPSIWLKGITSRFRHLRSVHRIFEVSTQLLYSSQRAHSKVFQLVDISSKTNIYFNSICLNSVFRRLFVSPLPTLMTWWSSEYSSPDTYIKGICCLLISSPAWELFHCHPISKKGMEGGGECEMNGSILSCLPVLTGLSFVCGTSVYVHVVLLHVPYSGRSRLYVIVLAIIYVSSFVFLQFLFLLLLRLCLLFCEKLFKMPTNQSRLFIIQRFVVVSVVTC